MNLNERPRTVTTRNLPAVIWYRVGTPLKDTTADWGTLSPTPQPHLRAGQRLVLTAELQSVPELPLKKLTIALKLSLP